MTYKLPPEAKGSIQRWMSTGMTDEEVAEEDRRAAERGRRPFSASLYSKHAVNERARYAARRAKMDGRLVPKPCERCGSTEKIHMHHPDHSKPLDVVWLCNLCHIALHAEERRNAPRKKAG